MVYAETMLQGIVGHNKSLKTIDLVLVYPGGTHYIGVG